MCGVLIGASFINNRLVFAEDVKEDEPSEIISAMIPEIYIKAVNPGYTVDGVANVGEMIEIGRTGSDEMISLAGLIVSYTNSSGNEAVLVEFPEHVFLAGESIILRLSSSPSSELAAVNYTKTLALKAGPLVLKRSDEILDTVCWTGKGECEEPFKTAGGTTLVRDLETGDFNHVENYEPVYDEKSYYVEADEEGYGAVMSQCTGLVFSEMLSYYDELQSEQFIEFYNSNAEQILLDGCMIRYKNKDYPLTGILKPEEYLVRRLGDFSLTKNPSNVNTLEIIDVDGAVVDKLEYPNGQRKGAAYALVGYDNEGLEIWRVTYAPTPGEANNYQEFKTCEEGKVINEETGNCVKAAAVTIEKVCAKGQYLNPLTGRCKKIETESVKTCKEGYYLNEETGRCKKIKENSGADYGIVVEEYEEKSSFVGLYILLGVLGLGLIYAIYEFRSEILRLLRKVCRRFR